MKVCAAPTTAHAHSSSQAALDEAQPTAGQELSDQPSWFDQLAGRGFKVDPKMFDPNAHVNVNVERTR